MNTYRITITTTRGFDSKPRALQFDVDALRSNTAITAVFNDFGVSFFERDFETVTCQLYAKDIFPLNDKTVRELVA